MADPKEVTKAELEKELVALRELSSKQAEDANAAKSRADGLAGDLERERQKTAALEAQVAQLQGEVKRLGGQVGSDAKRIHAELPKGAVELRDSVTTVDFEGNRITPRPNDVVLRAGEKKDDTKADVSALQKKLGEKYRVFAMAPKDIAELKSLGALHD